MNNIELNKTHKLLPTALLTALLAFNTACNRQCPECGQYHCKGHQTEQPPAPQISDYTRITNKIEKAVYEYTSNMYHEDIDNFNKYAKNLESSNPALFAELVAVVDGPCYGEIELKDRHTAEWDNSTYRRVEKHEGTPDPIIDALKTFYYNHVNECKYHTPVTGDQIIPEPTQEQIRLSNNFKDTVIYAYSVSNMQDRFPYNINYIRYLLKDDYVNMGPYAGAFHTYKQTHIRTHTQNLDSVGAPSFREWFLSEFPHMLGVNEPFVMYYSGLHNTLGESQFIYNDWLYCPRLLNAVGYLGADCGDVSAAYNTSNKTLDRFCDNYLKQVKSDDGKPICSLRDFRIAGAVQRCYSGKNPSIQIETAIKNKISNLGFDMSNFPYSFLVSAMDCFNNGLDPNAPTLADRGCYSVQSSAKNRSKNENIVLWQKVMQAHKEVAAEFNILPLDYLFEYIIPHTTEILYDEMDKHVHELYQKTIDQQKNAVYMSPLAPKENTLKQLPNNKITTQPQGKQAGIENRMQ